ncbi:hypothetical protein [Kitasatospora sp. KL5]|uniref:hypothetical protein n=1 Tax=Kitasatospora sp. KL5 TaxID=3425125 RepID=UPI003D6E1AA7
MSDLEKAAAEYARRQREHATQEAEAAQNTARENERFLLRGREFFAFARRHGAPLLHRYIELEFGDQPSTYRYQRTGERYIAAAPWGEEWKMFDSLQGWALREDGTVWSGLSTGISSHSSHDIVDRRYFTTRAARGTALGTAPERGGIPHYLCEEHFPAAGAALLDPIQLAPGVRTGIQQNGWIGYHLLH